MTVRACLLAVLLICAGGLGRSAAPHDVSLGEPLSNVPLRLGDWRGIDGPALEPEIERVLRADDYINRVYERAGEAAVGLWVAYYASQRQGDAIHSPLNCLPGTGWTPLQHTRSALTINGRPMTVNRYLIQKRGDRQVVLYWYQGRGRIVASEYVNKAYLLLDAFRYRRTDGALVRITAPVRGDVGGADRAAIAFVSALQPQLQRWLP